MRKLLQIAAILVGVSSEQLHDRLSIKQSVRSLNPADKNVDVQCYSDLNNIIYNTVHRNDVPRMEMHVTCNTKLDSVFRIVGDRPNFSLHCLENITTVISWLGMFSKNVKSLDISHNCIKTLNVISELPMLKILNCRHNSLEIIEDGAFEHLPQLEILDLSYNSLTGEQLTTNVFRSQCIRSNISNQAETLGLKDSGKSSVAWSCQASQIIVLNLGNNKIQSLHSNSFQHLHQLRELHLNNNPLSIVDANTIAAIRSVAPLKVLHLSNLHISKIPYRFLDGLKLQALYLNGNNLTQVPEELSLLGKSLLYLNINDNPIGILDYNSFIGLDNLKEVEVAGMPQLTSVYEGTFSHLPSLETVILSYNSHLSYIDPFAFMWSPKSPSSLKLVYLHENNLKHVSETLLPWRQLDVLQLSGNHWVCDCKLWWYFDLTERQNVEAVRNSGLRCASSKWPNNTQTNVYNRPMKKFDCAESSGMYLHYKRDSLAGNLVIFMFLAVLVGVTSAFLSKCAYNISLRNSVPAHDLHGISGPLNNEVQYSRLHKKSIYNV